jgi:hypothetical protein
MNAFRVAKCFLFSMMACTVWAAEPVAMVTDLKGNVTHTVDGKPAPLGLLAYLEPGTRLRLDAGARAVVTFFSRPVQVTLAGPAEALVEDGRARMLRGAPPQVRELDAARSGAARKLEPLQRERLAMATFHMRSTQPTVPCTSSDSSKTKRVATARPKPGAAFSDRVLYAALLETEGLACEAQEAWTALAKERPEDPTLKQWAERK